MKIKFLKMNGTGNDFIVIDNRDGKIDNASKLASKLCTRRVGIGADGLLLLENSNKADVRMRYLNSDGSEVAMCGNGARCTAFFANMLGLPDNFMMETGAGILSAEIDNDMIRIGMPEAEISTNAYVVEVEGERMMAYHANTGVDHKVLFLEHLESIPVEKIGRKIRYDKLFQPDGTNVNFVKVIDEKTIELRTYEKGVEAETLSCGTGATASALIAGALGLVRSPVTAKVALPAELIVEFDENIENIYLNGPVEISFSGEVEY
ncbi:MAG: diaminopimelate epimerase [Candidatus Zixiibacteriota bacterium]